MVGRNLLTSLLVVLFGTAPFAVHSANATNFYDFASSRGTFDTSGVDSVSYDGRGYDAFVPFTGATSNDILRFDSFSGVSGGSKLDFFLLSEVAAYDGFQMPGKEDHIGYVDSNGTFHAVLPPLSAPGASGSLILGEDETIALALSSPEGLFTSVDGNNPDGMAHLVGLEVTQDMLVHLSNVDLRNNSLDFQLMVGDIIVFAEDLLSFGNMLQGGLASDFDYNDVVWVIRHTVVPEPSTYLMLALALFSLVILKRRQVA